MKKGTTRYLGVDVHKATITLALAADGSQTVVYGTIAKDPSSVRKLVRQLGREAKLGVAYEAGPTGYALHRQLLELGAECTVVSVTAHCLAATALLTREYQGDHRRQSLTLTASRATHYPLDISFLEELPPR